MCSFIRGRGVIINRRKLTYRISWAGPGVVSTTCVQTSNADIHVVSSE